MRHYVPACKRGLPPTENLLCVYKPVGNLVSGFARQSSSRLYSTACRLFSHSVALPLIVIVVLVFFFCLFLISYFSDGSIFSAFHHNVHHHTPPQGMKTRDLQTPYKSATAELHPISSLPARLFILFLRFFQTGSLYIALVLPVLTV